MIENIPYELLARYFAGESPEDEKTLMEKWRKESSDNEKTFNEFSKIWNHSQTGDINFNTKVASALAEVNKKIELAEMQSDGKSKLRKIIFYAVRIAAVVALSMAVWYGYNKLIIKEVWITEVNEKKSIKELILADGTKITLNENSLIKYPEKFSKASRNVKLEGEAFFEVAKNPEKPFIISAQNSLTEVLGTAFNLRARTDEDDIVLTVEEGKVAFSTTTDDKILSVNLEAGEKGIFNKSSKTVTELKNDDINYMAWKTGRLSFNNDPLKKVAEDLSKFYNIRFEVENSEFDTIKILIEFNNNSLEEMVEAMDFIRIQITKKDNVYLIGEKTVQ